MRKYYFLIGLELTVSLSARSQKILFDNVKAESASNADWVVDADMHNLYISNQGLVTPTGQQSNAQRYPTPAQSTVTASTAENYWTGGISAWGIECAKLGYTVESLPYNVSITYGNSGNVQDLSNYDVYVIDEPNIRFTAAERDAIVNFVYNGGGLYMISDHTGSDRNFDGWDSPAIWNDLMNNNTVHVNPFGIKFDTLDFSGTFGITNIVGDSCLNGPFGTATQVKWSGGTSMTLSTSANATVKGDVYKTGSGSTNVLSAHGYFGKGRFAAISDSSPTDDASGDPGDQLYNGWVTDASGNHRKLIMNTTVWLMGGKVATGVIEPSEEHQISLYPNPIEGILRVRTNELCTLELFDMSGQKVVDNVVEPNYLKSINVSDLSAGIYMYRLTGDKTQSTGKIVKK
jgi:hypothetical protein